MLRYSRSAATRAIATNDHAAGIRLRLDQFQIGINSALHENRKALTQNDRIYIELIFIDQVVGDQRRSKPGSAECRDVFAGLQ